VTALRFADLNSLVAWRVTPAGELLDSAPAVIAYDVLRTSLAFDGSNFVVAWCGLAGDHLGMYVARIGTDGEVDAPHLVSGDDPVGSTIGIAATAGQSLAVWSNDEALRAVRLDGDLAPLDLAPLTLGTDARDLDVAVDGDGYRVASVEGHPGDYQTVTRSVSRDGVLGAPLTLLDGEIPSAPTIARGDLADSRRLIAWRDGGAWLDGAGEPQPVASWASSYSRSFRPAVAGGADGAYAVWVDERTDYPSVHGTRLDQDGTPLAAPTPLSIPDEITTMPAIAFDGTTYLAVWMRESVFVGSFMLEARRIGADGTLLDAEPFLVSQNGVEVSGGFSVTAGDGEFLVTWGDAPESGAVVRGRRVGSDGQLRDATPLSLTAGPEDSRPAAGFDGGRYLVVWQRGGSGLVGARMSPDGSLEAPFTIDAAADGDIAPAVAAGDGDFQVLWAGSQIATASIPGVGPVSPAIRYLAARGSERTSVALARSGSSQLAVWGEVASGSGVSVRAQLLVLGAPLGAPIELSDANLYDGVVSATSPAPHHFLVGYHDHGGTAPLETNQALIRGLSGAP
jgi:hypothetical protein